MPADSAPMTRRPRTFAALVLPVAAAVLAGAGGTAYAVAQARATASQSLSAVSTFGAQVGPVSGPVQPGPYSLAFPAILNNGLGQNGSRIQYGALRSTGGLALLGQTWQLQSPTTVPTATYDVDACVGALYNQADGSCTGTPLSVVSGAGASTTSRAVTTTIPMTTSTVVGVRVTQVVRTLGFTVQISIAVSRAQTTPGSRTTAA